MNPVTTIDLVAVITAGTSVLGTIIALISYYSQKIKDAEERGKLLNRVDQTEANLNSCLDRMAVVEDNHSANLVALERQAAAIDYIKQKLDDMVQWHAELAKSMHDIAARMPR